MKEPTRKLLSVFTKYLMILLMLGDIGVMACMPFMLKQMLVLLMEPAAADNLLPFYYVLLYGSGILIFLILNNLRCLFDAMIVGQPFERSTEKRMLRMGIESFLISGMLSVKIFVQISFMTITSAAVFVIAGLFCLVLSDLFHRAVDYKEENDLTV